jgi:lysophospholipase L1-like esterase
LTLRESDGNTDLDIGANNGVLDTDVAAAHVGSNNGAVRRVYSQFGGDDWINASAGTIGKPLLYSGGSLLTLSNRPAMRTTGTEFLTATGISGGTDYAMVLVIYADTVNSSNFIAASGGALQAYGQHLGGPGGIIRMNNGDIALDTPTSASAAQANVTWPHIQSNPIVIGMTAKSGASSLYINGWLAATSSTGPAVHVLDQWGAYLSSFGFRGEQSEMVIFNSADAAAFAPYMLNAMAYYGAASPCGVAGDSIPLGFPFTDPTMGKVLAATTPNPIYLVGQVGGTIANITTDLAADNAKFFAKLASASKAPCIIVCGVNDLNANTAMATIKSDLQALWSQQRTAGARVVACTLPGLTYTANITQSEYQELNAWIRVEAVNNSDIDDLIDFAADAVIGEGMAGTSTTDGTHLTVDGQARMATIIATYLSSGT